MPEKIPDLTFATHPFLHKVFRAASKNGCSVIYGPGTYGDGVTSWEVLDGYGDLHPYCSREKVEKLINEP